MTASTTTTTTIDEYQVARLLSATRLAIGGLLLVAPGLVARRWLGSAQPGPEVKVLSRAAGARELALAAGALRALSDGGDARPWILGAAASDAVDAVAALTALGRRQPLRALLTVAAASGAAAVGTAVANQLAADVPRTSGT